MAQSKPTARRSAENLGQEATFEVACGIVERPVEHGSGHVSGAEVVSPFAGRNHTGRRFAESHRYGAAVGQGELETRFSGGDSVRSDSTHSAVGLHQPKSRRGFALTAAAVAAVSGLTLAAMSPQLAEDDVQTHAAEAQRTATSAVVDVQAPGSAQLEVERAALTSERSESAVKEDRFSQVLTASSGDVSSIATQGLLDRPLESNRITSPFGHRKNPTGPGYMNHSGIDYGVACGTPVMAAASGTVTVSDWAGHSGKRVTISHGNGLETGYSHNSTLIAKVGQKVERGEVIALSGTTGNSTGCHVHFEVITNGKFQNPAGWL